ncbi:MAG: DUF58 domain-containing protein [Candidatus Dormibacteria bacterium]
MSSAVRRLLVVGGIILLFFFAYITAIRQAFMLAYFSVLLLALCWAWARFAGRGLTVSRQAPGLAYEVGQEFREKLEVANGSVIGAPWVAVEDRAGIPGYDASRVFGLRGRGTRKWSSNGRFAARGRFTLGPMRVTTGDPFGFFQSSRVIAVAESITVYPRLVDVSGFLPGSATSSGDSRVFGRYTDTPPDALGIREYDPSDGFNRIHWPSTARLGRPMSRSFERYEGSDTLVILDLGVGVHRGQGSASTLEQGISLTASVAMMALQRGQSVALRCNDAAGTSFPSASGPQHMRRILDFLAIAQANGTRGLDSALPGAAGRSAQSVVVITPAAAGAWLDAVAGGRDGGRRTTVLHVSGAEGEAAHLHTVAGMSWWDVGTVGFEDTTARRPA